uniref:Uncharacterized protein n=1 Tax=Aegilops tauschii subsp. strangulata TaxID=200361 RepID=A0A453NFE7_AEGTS
TLRARAAGGEGGAEEQGPVIQCMKWGLVPSFSSKTDKPDHFRMVRYALTFHKFL